MRAPTFVPPCGFANLISILKGFLLVYNPLRGSKHLFCVAICDFDPMVARRSFMPGPVSPNAFLDRRAFDDLPETVKGVVISLELDWADGCEIVVRSYFSHFESHFDFVDGYGILTVDGAIQEVIMSLHNRNCFLVGRLVARQHYSLLVSR